MELTLVMTMVALPAWLKDEHAITLATWGLVLVTFLLVVATFFLWLDSWKRGREQRERWRMEDNRHDKDREEERARWLREDERYLAEQKPKFNFEMEVGNWQKSIHDITFQCLNLGSVAFEIESVFFRIVSELEYEDKLRVFHPHRIVKAGEMLQVGIPRQLYEDLNLRVDVELSLEVDSGTIKAMSSNKCYCLFLPDRGRVMWTKEGLHETRVVKCDQCGANGFFEPNGLKDLPMLEGKLDTARRELNESCPAHDSTVLRSVMNADLSIKRFSGDA